MATDQSIMKNIFVEYYGQENRMERITSRHYCPSTHQCPEM
jgi:hypothetical protein